MAYPQSVATSRAVVDAALEFTEATLEVRRMSKLTGVQIVAEFGSTDAALARLQALQRKRRQSQDALYDACAAHRAETRREHVNGPNIDADRSTS